MGTGRWRGVPLRARLVVSAAVLVFAYGTVVHVLQVFVPGLRPPLALPGWLAVYFGSLTLWDPFAALLLAARRPAGLALGCAVLVTDAAANGYANDVLDPAGGRHPGPDRAGRHHRPRRRPRRAHPVAGPVVRPARDAAPLRGAATAFPDPPRRGRR